MKSQVWKNPNAISRIFWLQCAGELENQTTKENGPAAVKLLIICHLKINHCLEKKKKKFVLGNDIMKIKYITDTEIRTQLFRLELIEISCLS